MTDTALPLRSLAVGYLAWVAGVAGTAALLRVVGYADLPAPELFAAVLALFGTLALLARGRGADDADPTGDGAGWTRPPSAGRRSHGD